MPSTQRAELDATHPDGTARFWGATAKHDKKMDTLAAGDVVLLTGQKHVRAVGEVGCSFRNHEFARRLWTPDPANCLWSNVYSLRVYRTVWIPYEEIWALPGFTTGDNFMGLRFLNAPKGATVLSGLQIRRMLRSGRAGSSWDATVSSCRAPDLDFLEAQVCVRAGQRARPARQVSP